METLLVPNHRAELVTGVAVKQLISGLDRVYTNTAKAEDLQLEWLNNIYVGDRVILVDTVYTAGHIANQEWKDPSKEIYALGGYVSYKVSRYPEIWVVFEVKYVSGSFPTDRSIYDFDIPANSIAISNEFGDIIYTRPNNLRKLK